MRQHFSVKVLAPCAEFEACTASNSAGRKCLPSPTPLNCEEKPFARTLRFFNDNNANNANNGNIFLRLVSQKPNAVPQSPFYSCSYRPSKNPENFYFKCKIFFAAGVYNYSKGGCFLLNMTKMLGKTAKNGLNFAAVLYIFSVSMLGLSLSGIRNERFEIMLKK